MTKTFSITLSLSDDTLKKLIKEADVHRLPVKNHIQNLLKAGLEVARLQKEGCTVAFYYPEKKRPTEVKPLSIKTDSDVRASTGVGLQHEASLLEAIDKSVKGKLVDLKLPESAYQQLFAAAGEAKVWKEDYALEILKKGHKLFKQIEKGNEVVATKGFERIGEFTGLQVTFEETPSARAAQSFIARMEKEMEFRKADPSPGL